MDWYPNTKLGKQGSDRRDELSRLCTIKILASIRDHAPVRMMARETRSTMGKMTLIPLRKPSAIYGAIECPYLGGWRKRVDDLIDAERPFETVLLQCMAVTIVHVSDARYREHQ